MHHAVEVHRPRGILQTIGMKTATVEAELPTRSATSSVHTLHPGDVVCAERGDRLETLLGSCVAIVLTDPRRTIGAMCHIVHCSRALAGAPETSAYATTWR